VTWVFIFVAALLVGLALATVTGLLHDVTALIRHNPMVSPRHNAARTIPTRLLRCLSAWLGAAGAAGLAFHAWRPFDSRGTAYSAAIAGTLAVLLLGIVLGRGYQRERARTKAASQRRSRATVIRAIPAGGYGQIRLDRAGIIMAAQAEDGRSIAEGAAVEVLDTERTVVRVRPVQE
jgi:hypothetical protein